MNPLTTQLLNHLWKDAPTFDLVASRLASECQTMSPVEAAVIGRDLILRRRALDSREFKLAAYLASDSLAGNDGFLDFADCVALLPDERYQRILANPDELVDDPVSSGFDEFCLVTQVTQVFDRALLGDEEGGLLDYLVLGDDEVDWPHIEEWTEEEAKDRLPRLYEKFGHFLHEAKSVPPRSKNNNVVTLDDFFGGTGSP